MVTREQTLAIMVFVGTAITMIAAAIALYSEFELLKLKKSARGYNK